MSKTTKNVLIMFGVGVASTITAAWLAHKMDVSAQNKNKTA
ncbi:hypothetical protein ACPV36_19510 [Photobacterium damselae]